MGSNSPKAKGVALDLYLTTNSSIQSINIEEHKNVERDQWITMATAHMLATALRETDYPLEKFDFFATLNSELQVLPIGRTLGQGTRIPSEIIYNQPMKWEFFESLKQSLAALEQVLDDKDLLLHYFK